MLHTKFRGNRPAGSGEEDFRRVFTICGRGGHLGHVTQMPRANLNSLTQGGSTPDAPKNQNGLIQMIRIGKSIHHILVKDDIGYFGLYTYMFQQGSVFMLLMFSHSTILINIFEFLSGSDSHINRIK